MRLTSAGCRTDQYNGTKPVPLPLAVGIGAGPGTVLTRHRSPPREGLVQLLALIAGLAAATSPREAAREQSARLYTTPQAVVPDVPWREGPCTSEIRPQMALERIGRRTFCGAPAG